MRFHPLQYNHNNRTQSDYCLSTTSKENRPAATVNTVSRRSSRCIMSDIMALRLIVHQRLLEFLDDRPTAYIDEMAWFLYDEFDLIVSLATIHDTLSRLRWSRKTTHRKAQERSEDL